MNTLSKAFGKKFEENKDLVRIRSFDFGGHTFKVKVPLTSEYEAMMLKVNEVNEEKVTKYYSKLAKSFIENKDDLDPKLGVIFKENDIEVQGRSLMNTAKTKLITENQITAMVQMLVPEEKGFDMTTITYEMVEELFPFSVQMELLQKISEVVAPNYKETKGK
jgi:6-pyruvoyl-tetrahydropterin synthase